MHINEKARAAGTFWLAAWGAAVLLAFALAVAGSAQAGIGPLAPALTLGKISLDTQTAVVTGSVEGPVDARLEVNGNGVVLDDRGAFTSLIDVAGVASLDLDLSGLHGEQILVRVPLHVVVSKGGEGVLDELELAGISIDVPAGGFTILDGRLPHVTGSVLRPHYLAKLTINGHDVLTLLGRGGRFVFPAPKPSAGESPDVVVRAVDHEGVTQTTVFKTTRVTTAISTRVGTSVAAAAAQGIRVAGLNFDTRRVLSERRLAVVLTVRDRGGNLVRGAAVRLVGMPQRYVANGPTRLGFTNRLGQSRFVYVLRKSALSGKTRRTFIALARVTTPLSRASSWSSHRLPCSRAR